MGGRAGVQDSACRVSWAGTRADGRGRCGSQASQAMVAGGEGADTAATQCEWRHLLDASVAVRLGAYSVLSGALIAGLWKCGTARAHACLASLGCFRSHLGAGPGERDRLVGKPSRRAASRFVEAAGRLASACSARLLAVAVARWNHGRHRDNDCGRAAGRLWGHPSSTLSFAHALRAGRVPHVTRDVGWGSAGSGGCRPGDHFLR